MYGPPPAPLVLCPPFNSRPPHPVTASLYEYASEAMGKKGIRHFVIQQAFRFLHRPLKWLVNFREERALKTQLHAHKKKTRRAEALPADRS